MTDFKQFSTNSILFKLVPIAPLVTFRVLFGLLMFASTLRFYFKGWIEELYVKPIFFFKYYGFEWVEVPNEIGLYLLFGIIALSALMISLGLFYKISAIVFFLSFTYSELLDVTNYLNHYYFVSVVALLLIFLPAGKSISLDVKLGFSKNVTHIPFVFIGVLQLQLAIVYIFAGLAKLNPDWIIEALPLKIWLPPHSDLSIIGSLLSQEWTAYLFSWFGAFYDLTIVFFLLHPRTWKVAYLAVLIFHITTAILFPIGMFPYVMIFATLIFFPSQFHQSLWIKVKSIFNQNKIEDIVNEALYTIKPVSKSFLTVIFFVHFCIQIFLPLRYLLYPGNVLWTEQGFRFSWRVMLIEKNGQAQFYITDPATNRTGEAMQNNYLTANQEKMMASQPDLILQYAHFLKEKYEESGIENPIITAESYVTLNGRGSQMFIDDSVNLTKISDSFKNKNWILPLEQ